MIIDIAALGGFGGINAARLHKTIDVDNQPDGMRRDLCDAFEPEQLARLARKPCSGCADRPTYRITVTAADRQTRSFTLREGQLPPDMLDLIDRM